MLFHDNDANNAPTVAVESFAISVNWKLNVAGAKLDDIRSRNAISELNNFTIYVITAYKGSAGSYPAEKHVNCTIAYNSIGGDANVNMPISVYLSNDLTNGTVDKLSDDFEFTPKWYN